LGFLTTNENLGLSLGVEDTVDVENKRAKERTKTSNKQVCEARSIVTFPVSFTSKKEANLVLYLLISSLQ